MNDLGVTKDRRFRFVAMSGALAVAMHLPLRGGWRSRSRVAAAGMLVVGAVGLRADTGWSAWLTLGGSLGAVSVMRRHPGPYDFLALCAVLATVAAIAGRKARYVRLFVTVVPSRGLHDLARSMTEVTDESPRIPTRLSSATALLCV